MTARVQRFGRIGALGVPMRANPTQHWAAGGWLAACAAGVMGLPAGDAHAVPHRLCLSFDIGDELWDASPRAFDGEELWEEYGRNTGPTGFPAQRRLVHIRDDSTGRVVWGWRPLGGWAPFQPDVTPGCNCGVQPPPPPPGNAGCADFELDDPTTTFTVQWTRWSVWGDPAEPTAPATGNQVIGYNCDETMAGCRFDIPFVSGVLADPSGETHVSVPHTAPDVHPVDLPLWAVTFAEDRFAALGEQPLENTTFYVGYDENNVLPGLTQADRTFGNQPSVVIGGNSYHGKFVATHEYGHQQTMAAFHPSFDRPDVNYCYSPDTYPGIDDTCEGPQHLVFSSEWQGAAALEGFAHWYAVSTWHDVDDAECGGCMNRTSFVSIQGADLANTYAVPRNQPVCPVMAVDPCPAGVGNEHDWVSALRQFRLDAASRPDFRTMLTMLEAYYGTGNWVAADPSDAFWVGFDAVMPSHLGPHYPDWEATASAWRLDR
jgi:hypothetical protein